MAAMRSNRIPTRKGRWLIFFRRRFLAGFPWYWPARPFGLPVMMTARRMVRSSFGSEHHVLLRLFAKILVTLAWPAAVFVNLAEAHRVLPPGLISLPRAAGALWAAIRHNVMPTEYFAYGLWRSESRKNVDNYLYSNEAARLFKIINRPRVPDPIGDKLAFYSMCTAHGLPTPAVLAALSPTRLLQGFRFDRPPECDLFVKAASRGFHEQLLWRGSNFVSDRGWHVGMSSLVRYLADQAKSANLTLVVQPALANDPALHIEPGGALATVRLVTGRSSNGDVRPIFSYILFGRPKKITAHSNCVTLVDIANGRMMPLPSKNAPGTWMYEYRTFSDGYKLNNWDAALRHVTVAHTICSNFVYVGWDLAFTEHGPVLLEGNANWDPTTFQVLCDQPLGNTTFADILAAHLGSQ